MGIGQEHSDLPSDDTDQHQDDTDGDTTDQETLDETNEIELELAGKPWPVASSEIVIFPSATFIFLFSHVTRMLPIIFF